MAKRDYSDTGQRSQSDELFEDIFQLALTRDQRKKKAAQPVVQTDKKSRVAPDASPAQTRKVTPAPPLRRSGVRLREQKAEERKAAPRKPRSGRLTKILIGLLLLAGTGAVATFLMPGYELADFLRRKQEPSTVKKEMPKRPSPPPVSTQPGKMPSRFTPAAPESPLTSKAQAKNETTPRPGFLPSVEMTREGEMTKEVDPRQEIASTKEGDPGGKGEIKVEPGPPSQAETYPYSVYLGSYKREDAAQKALAAYKEKGLSPYLVRMDLGSKGVWLRVFSGHFGTQEEAEAFFTKNQISEAETKHTRYAVLIGAYPSREEAEARVRALKDAGCHPYVIGVSQASLRVYAGAYYRMEDAEKELAWLASKGVNGEIVER